MAKVKICPSCGYANQPGILECIQCEADLSGVKLVEDQKEEEALRAAVPVNVREAGEIEEALRGAVPVNGREAGEIGEAFWAAEAAKEREAENAEYVRICDCGFQNPMTRRKCTQCGEDLSDITPVPKKEGFTESFHLCSQDGSCNFFIPEGETMIGRECTLKEYLSGKPFVSRQHARIFREGTHVYVENLSQTNYTFVNDRQITGRTELFLGDRVGLGGIRENEGFQAEAAYFKFQGGDVEA